MKLKNILGIALVTLPLVGCLNEESNGKVSEKSQVAVNVNGQEITFTEYNEYLKRIPNTAGKDEKEIEKIKSSVLEGLIEQKLLLQAAKEAGVEKEADVITAIDMAKNKLIIEAYLAKVLTGVAKPADQQLEGFYNTNKVLFGERKIYGYDQYIIKVNITEAQKIKDKLKLLDRSNELPNFLKANNIEFTKQSELRTSEKLPPKLALAMTRLNEGDIGYFDVSDGIVIIGLNQAKQAPIDFESAKKFITPVLEKEMREKFVKNMIEGIRATSKIEYNPILKPDELTDEKIK